jgi:hypothetical protein
MATGESALLDPVELAANAARYIPFQEDTPSAQKAAVRILSELQQAVTALDIINRRYWIETGRGIALPKPEVQEMTAEGVPVQDFYGLHFEGLFRGYAKLDIGSITHHDTVGRRMGSTSVKALCLTFNEATLLPLLEELPEEQLLFVPVPAVDIIDQTERGI